MQTENLRRPWKEIIRVALRYTTAAILLLALPALALCVLKMQTEMDDLRDILESSAMNIETMQTSVERLARAIPTFSIARFDLNYKKDEYGEGYSGTAIISCDLPDASIVILKTTLLSGGSAYTEEVSYSLVIVHDGIGRYPTYDWGETGKIEKPEYKFEVVGYLLTEKTGE